MTQSSDPVRDRTAEPTILIGVGASAGVSVGAAIVAFSPDEVQASVAQDSPFILVTTMTDPEWLLVMSRASGIVTDQGGLLSHPAIVARELGIPCVVGTRTATSQLSTGSAIRIDGLAGTVSLVEAE